MEHITSRKNNIITHLRALGSDRTYRHEQGLFLCDGQKLLEEALQCGASIDCVLWGENAGVPLPAGISQFTCPDELLQYASPLKNTVGPVFAARMSLDTARNELKNLIVLENVQDPGNVGTVVRTADAMGISAVVLLGECADVYNPKTVRSTMGAIFRQTILEVDRKGLRELLSRNNMKLYGAALTDCAKDIRKLELSRAAVAIGSEGRGLSEEMLAVCDEQLIIPMQPDSESLNAAVAASLVMWEMRRNNGEGRICLR